MNLEGIKLNEMSDRERQVLYDLTCMWNLTCMCKVQTNINQKQIQIRRKKWVIIIGEGSEVGEIGEGD